MEPEPPRWARCPYRWEMRVFPHLHPFLLVSKPPNTLRCRMSSLSRGFGTLPHLFSELRCGWQCAVHTSSPPCPPSPQAPSPVVGPTTPQIIGPIPVCVSENLYCSLNRIKSTFTTWRNIFLICDAFLQGPLFLSSGVSNT